MCCQHRSQYSRAVQRNCCTPARRKRRPSSRRLTWIGPARIDAQFAHDYVTRHVFPLLADRLQPSARHPAPLR